MTMKYYGLATQESQIIILLPTCFLIEPFLAPNNFNIFHKQNISRCNNLSDLLYFGAVVCWAGLNLWLDGALYSNQECHRLCVCYYIYGY